MVERHLRSTRRPVTMCVALLVAAAALVPAPAWPAAEANVNGRAKAATARRDLLPCRNIAGARCGEIEVPVDPRFPDLGTTNVGFALYPRHDRDHPSRGTIVAVEGGPGYSTIASRFGYVQLFRPLRRHRDLLLVDVRGTGRSDAVRCRALQTFRKFAHDVPWSVAERRCARRLGPKAELYGTAFAADDLASVLDVLGIDQIDLYGDSYGTFFGQTFAVRHPDRVRTLTLDAAYPIEGWDPWWRDLSSASNDGVRLACERDPECARAFPHPMTVLRRLAASVRRRPIVGDALDARGRTRRVRFGPEDLGMLLGFNGYGPPIDQELLAAARAAVRRHRDTAPLLRMAAEQDWYWGGGNARGYSQGLATATGCNDDPKLWDPQSPVATRKRQFARAVRRLEREDPRAFDPLRIDEWAHAYDSVFGGCLRWPAPEDWVSPFPHDAVYPDTPALVLVGDLDSVTSPKGAAAVAGRFPGSTFVKVPNMFHVSALGDYVTGIRDFPHCLSRIVRRFVRTTAPGETACADSAYPPLSVRSDFPRRAARVPARSEMRRAALVAAGTVGDVLTRWFVMSGRSAAGLRGGVFTIHGSRRTRFSLDAVRWVRDVPVSGTVTWWRPGGRVEVDVTLSGGVPGSHLRLRWNVWRPLEPVHARGTVGGRRVRLTVPTP